MEFALSTILLVSVASAFVTQPANATPWHVKFLNGPIKEIYYDGISDDLLTAGLGASGLATGVAPGFANPLDPTAAELRRLAIYNNYLALVPEAPGGGYGLLFGPNIDKDGNPTGDEGLIPGTEFIAYGKGNVVYMVQLPDSFDLASPCIVTAPSSGSRGIYGAIGTSGEWGLKRGCAIAYTDKGTGIGAHNLETNTVNLINGSRADAQTAGRDSHFTARISKSRRASFNETTPNRFAVKHAHSQTNPENDWGQHVLNSIKFAFHVLNHEYSEASRQDRGRGGHRPNRFNTRNTLVIASSVSNGGGASVRAAEQDRHQLIDGVAVSEPNVNPKRARFVIQQQGRSPVRNHSKSLYDYTTYLNVYQGCASAAEENATAPFNFAPNPNACASLKDKGLLTSDTLAEQAAEAQAKINTYGFVQEQNALQPSHWFVNVPQSISMTYANAYSRSNVTANLCGYSFGATDAVGVPVAMESIVENALFSAMNGIPPSAGMNLINNLSIGGPLANALSISPSTGRADYNLDGALCLRRLNGTSIDGVKSRRNDRKHRRVEQKLKTGIRQVLATGRLRGTPAVIVTGRADAILPINHTSRPYYALSQLRDGRRSNLRYYEIINAHHLDAFNDFPGFAEAYIPLHHYLFEALDIMYAHLTEGTPLPPSQVVHTIPRGSDGTSARPISSANVPDINPTPSRGNLIQFDGKTLFIPD